MDLFQQTAAPIAGLMSVVDRLPQDRREFAASLITQAQRGRPLSDKQLYWVGKLTAMAADPAKAEPAKVENLLGVIELFDRASSSKLKHPKITLDISEVGVPLTLSRAGVQARQPGSVNATDGRPYGENRWYGRIERNGTFVASRDCPDELVAFLGRLSTDAANVAAMYGRRTGLCAFCSAPLTDERSIEVGYGPVCAKNWGLPYPKKSEVGSRAQLRLVA